MGYITLYVPYIVIGSRFSMGLVVLGVLRLVPFRLQKTVLRHTFKFLICYVCFCIWIDFFRVLYDDLLESNADVDFHTLNKENYSFLSPS